VRYPGIAGPEPEAKSWSVDNFAIVTDSSCGLPPELVEKYGVTVVPILLHWEGRFVRDGLDVTAAEVYERLRSDPSVTVSSATPSPADFLREYDRLLETHDSILSVHVSGRLTSVIERARQAADERVDGRGATRITVVDSRTASMGLGFAVLAAARARKRGADIRSAAEEARSAGERSRLYGMLETLKYVQSSGRLAGLGMKAGSALRLRPLIAVGEDEVRFLSMVRTRSRGIAKILELVGEESRGLPVHASVVHAGVPAEAEALAATVREQVECLEMIVSEFTPVLGGHTGPGFIGVVVVGDA
jgi:DegV family protein with EDD domain